jgi:hypothetical protein
MDVSYALNSPPGRRPQPVGYAMRPDRPDTPQLTYPWILEAIGERPPEDSGGPYGYAEMLEALGDAEHEYHEEALENLGEEYDPNRPPNIAFIEAKLAALAKKWAPKPRPTR